MKTYLRKLVTVAAFVLIPFAAFAQPTVSRQPKFVASQAWLDLGNGPQVVAPLAGSGNLYSALGTGTGSTSGSSTTLTLTGTPAIKPCKGCGISGVGIDAGTTVADYNGTTTITLSAAMTVTAAALSWGSACPTSGTPPTTLGAPTEMRGGGPVPFIVPIYSYARLCVYGAAQGGLTFANFNVDHW